MEWPELFGPTSLSTSSNHNNFLAISYLNARSIVNKLSILENYIVNNIHAKTDFFFTKTWLSYTTPHCLFCPLGYNCLRYDRVSGWEVLVVYNNKVNITQFLALTMLKCAEFTTVILAE